MSVGNVSKPHQDNTRSSAIWMKTALFWVIMQ